jgi:hypothetical protein
MYIIKHVRGIRKELFWLPDKFECNFKLLGELEESSPVSRLRHPLEMFSYWLKLLRFLTKVTQ